MGAMRQNARWGAFSANRQPRNCDFAKDMSESLSLKLVYLLHHPRNMALTPARDTMTHDPSA